ncbi:hypothetical protein NQZ68_002902 [Dissostichus eleginoides]|nr:hypothetical protein NQZ68_002902 [Dissostichus eleginoides]
MGGMRPSSFSSVLLSVCLPGWAWLTYIWISVFTPLLLLFISLIATTHLNLLKTLVPILSLRQFFVYSSVIHTPAAPPATSSHLPGLSSSSSRSELRFQDSPSASSPTP